MSATAAWQVIRNGVMVDAVTGLRPDGREVTTSRIYREGQIVPGGVTQELAARYDAGDAHARSIVRRVEVDEDGAVSAAGEKSESLEGASDEELKARAEEAVQVALAAGDERDEALTKVAELEARVAELENKLAQAEQAIATASVVSIVEGDAAGDSFNIDAAAKPELEAEVAKRSLSVTGTGSNGNVTVEDLKKALKEDDAAKS